MKHSKMLILRGLIVTSLIVCCSSLAWGDNSVVIDSQTVCAGAKNVTIAIKITNDRDLRHVTVPLEVRSVSGGASVTSMKMSWGDRMPIGPTGPLGENGFTNQLAAKNCPCARKTNQGYGDITSSDTLSHAVAKLPIAVLFSRFRMMGKNLEPGADKTGSFLMTVDVGAKAGTFEIDTTCVCPSHSLMFVDANNNPRGVFPAFTKGVITVKACEGKAK